MLSEEPESAELRALLAEGVSDGIFSGAVLRIEDLKGAGAHIECSEGRVSSAPIGPVVTPATLFDIASLTKLFSATVTLRLIAEGSLSLDADVAALLGGRSQHLNGVTVRHLLEHRSGLPAWRAFFEGSESVLHAAMQEPLEAAPGTRYLYSDVGFLVLMAVLEKVSGLSYSHLMIREVLVPLGLYETGYRSSAAGESVCLARVAEGEFAATEQCSYRGLLCGEVHDDNTWAMGGVAAHAGLFASAAQLGAFARGWWDAPQLGYLPADLRDQVWSAPNPPYSHVLGWDTVTAGVSSVGSKLSRISRGHLGFTGTSLWIDPERAVAVVFLSNRVHPSREGVESIRRFRPRLHDAVADFVDQVG